MEGPRDNTAAVQRDWDSVTLKVFHKDEVIYYLTQLWREGHDGCHHGRSGCLKVHLGKRLNLFFLSHWGGGVIARKALSSTLRSKRFKSLHCGFLAEVGLKMVRIAGVKM